MIQGRTRLWIVRLSPTKISNSLQRSLMETLAKHPPLMKRNLAEIQIVLIDFQ
jgi:hypothetical protein